MRRKAMTLCKYSKYFVPCEECGVAFLFQPPESGHQWNPDAYKGTLGLCPTHRAEKFKKDTEDEKFRRDCERYRKRINKLVNMWDMAYLEKHGRLPYG